MIRLSKQNGHGFEDMTPDLTSMLDVIFILLIFFILSANSVQRTFEMQLPEKGADQAQPIDKTEITLGLFAESNRWQVNDDRFHKWDQVEHAILNLHQQHPESAIVIAGDKDASMETLLQAITFLKREGLETAHILMKSDIK